MNQNEARVSMGFPELHPTGIVWHSLTGTSTALCPDLLSIDDIGVADNLRGRVVRAFFRAIAWWTP